MFRNKQFAVVENPGFWNWTFTLKDADGNVLAEVDRDWRGFGFEVRGFDCLDLAVFLLARVHNNLMIYDTAVHRCRPIRDPIREF